MPTIRSVIADALDEHSPVAFVRGAGVQCSDVAKFVQRLVASEWPDQAGPLPRASEPLRAGQVAAIMIILDAQLGMIDQVIAVSAKMVPEVAEILARRGVSRRRPLIGERVVTALGSFALARRTVPDPGEFEEISAGIAAALSAAQQKLSRVEFANTYASDYERLWADRGAANLSSCPPEGISLGRNERPLLVQAPHRGKEGGWYAGTDRSVYGRYVLHFNSNAATRSRTGRRQPPAGEGTDPRAAEDLGMLELTRACEPYGLRHEEHRVILRSLFAGARVDRDERQSLEQARALWRTWKLVDAEISVERPVDPELADAVQAFATLWTVERTRGRNTAEWYAPIESRSGEVTAAVVRKAWMDLLRYERENLEPARRSDVTTMVLVAFDQGVPDALRYWPTREGEPDLLRHNNTWALLRTRRSLAEEIASAPGGTSWRPSYEQTVQRVGSAAGQTYLTAAELSQRLAGHLVPADPSR